MELMELVKCFEDLWGWNLDNELIWCTHWENNAEELIFLWQRVEEIRTSYEARTAEALEISYYKWLSTLVDMGSYGNNVFNLLNEIQKPNSLTASNGLNLFSLSAARIAQVAYTFP
jgi:hypothetical protein